MMENSWDEKDDADMDQLAKETVQSTGRYTQSKKETNEIAL